MEINLFCLQYIIVENTLSKHKSGKIFALALCRKIERKTSITNTISEVLQVTEKSGLCGTATTLHIY